MRGSAVDLPLAFPVHAADAPRARMTSTRAPVVRDADVDTPRAVPLKLMVARTPIVRDDDDDEAEGAEAVVVESMRARTISTATKRSMVARAPTVRVAPPVVPTKETLGAESGRARTISTATKRSMIPRAPAVRAEDNEDEDEDGAGIATPTHLPIRARTISAAHAKSVPPSPMLARGPTAPVISAEEDDTPPNARRPAPTASDASSRRRKLLLAPFARDGAESEYLASPGACARTESTNARMVVRAATVRDEEEEMVEGPGESALVVESVRARTISTAAKRSMVARAPIVRDDADDEGNAPLPPWARARPLCAPIPTRTTHRRCLSPVLPPAAAR